MGYIRRNSGIDKQGFSCALLIAGLAYAAAAWAQQPANSSSNDQLSAVFARIDKNAAAFRSAEADFQWDEYTKVVDEHDIELGKVYFRKQGHDIEMAAHVNPAAADASAAVSNRKKSGGRSSTEKFVLYSAGKVQIYYPANDHLDVYGTGKSHEAVESFLVLGFGGTSSQMLQSFDVSYGGHEKIDGTDTDMLELIPKAQKVKDMFSHIELWIDSRGISVQQKLTTPEDDYRLNKYSNVVLDKKISDNIFRLKMGNKTTVDNH